MMLQFLYRTIPGRMLLKVLTRPELSQSVGRFMDSPLSKPLIPGFIRANHIDMSDYRKERYRCFNDFFCRRIAPGRRLIHTSPEVLISPCDGLLNAYPINNSLVIPVKQSRYAIDDLLRDEELARRFDGGTCLVFRLCVNHYHRYCYPANGIKSDNVFLPGILHTVRPIALREVPVFTENAREYTVLDTDNFGSIVQMEVGAMLVGRIDNYHPAGLIRKGQEKGRFLYGGSTIILLLEPGRVRLPRRFFANTLKGRETPITMGVSLGTCTKLT